MAHEIRRPSRLPDPCCGRRLYRVGVDDPGVLVDVTFEEGEQVAYVAEGEDAGLVLPVATMDGEFLDPHW